MSERPLHPNTDDRAPSYPGPTLRILLVDDDEDDYLLTRDLLAEIPACGIDLEWAAGYDAGLDALREDRHDVFLFDYRLGRRNGVELLAEAVSRGCRAPAILLTGQGERDVDIEAMRAGAADYLVKGKIDSATLERSIRYAVERKRDQDALRRLHADLEDRVRERTLALERANGELHREVEQRRRAEEALRQADRRKDEFLATLAHELRNPLAPIRNALQILKLAGHDPRTSDDALALMERQLSQMVRLIDDLLDVSRISCNKLELRRERVELASVIRNAVETSRPLIEAAAHELCLALPDRAIYVDADASRLSQVFANLLNNAAKYTEPGGTITLSAERHGIETVVTVRDDGAGIPPEMLPHIFNLFTQVDRTLSRSQGGLGIGLTLVQRLVAMHGGSVEARSEGPGKGSEFAVRLPIAPEPPPHPTHRDPAAIAASTPCRVLVVDDNEDAARTLGRLLSLMGHEALTAFDGVEAVAMAGEHRPDVILLDIGLPTVDGYEVARAIRREPWGERLLMVALTGWGQDADRRRSLQAGFDLHLVKPVEPQVLRGLLATRVPNEQDPGHLPA
jgi:signal transduction histidine kinase